MFSHADVTFQVTYFLVTRFWLRPDRVVLHENLFFRNLRRFRQLARKRLTHRRHAIGLRQRQTIEPVVCEHLQISCRIAVMKRYPRIFFPEPRAPHQEMRLHRMRNDNVRLLKIVEENTQPGNHTQIKTVTLRNRNDFNAGIKQRAHKFIRVVLNAAPSKRDHGTVHRYFAFQLARRAQKLEHDPGDGVHRRGFDQRNELQFFHPRSERSCWYHSKSFAPSRAQS